jgi:uncharacterized coiled-coil protein SlyX
MDSDTLRLALQAINMIGTFGIGCWLYIEKRNDRTNERIDDAEARQNLYEKELAALKSSLTSAPRHEDLSRIYDAINALAERLNQMVGENRSQSDFLKMILNRLTEKGLS